MYDLISVGDMGIDVFLEMTKDNVNIIGTGSDRKLALRFADKIPVEHFTRTIGGNAANLAVGFSRLGYKSALATILGEDKEGEMAYHQLFREGVDLRYIRHHEKRTNFSTVINFQGERTILIYHEPRDYHWPRPAHSRYLYLTSMKDGWQTIIDPLSKYLEQTNTKLAYNPGTYQLEAGAKVSQKLLDQCEIIFVNKEEAMLYTGHKAETDIDTLLRALHKMGPRIVVITDGPKGSYASDDTGQYEIGIFDVPVIERTGCGDAYATGFLAALRNGKDIQEAMRWGSFEAASVLQKIGPEAGLLHRKQLHEYEEKYKNFTAKPLTTKRR